MDLLLIGSGGREHAIAWKLAQNPQVGTIYCAPGNGGTATENKCRNLAITAPQALVEFARAKQVALTIVGPEAPLTQGIVDLFQANGLRIFGPSRQGARLEGSKAYAKAFMQKYGVKTAAYAVFSDAAAAAEYMRKQAFPLVVKADGLAAGKGVFICWNFQEGQAALDKLMHSAAFGAAGQTVVIEEYLAGVEASILSLTDGRTILPFLSAKDHKQIFDGNRGPNTGGMGVVAPNPYVDAAVLAAFRKEIMEPTLAGIQKEQLDYIGIIFFGLMITKKGVYLLEYNVRMGDPETQAILPLLQDDLLVLLEKAMARDLQTVQLHWKKQVACVAIAAAAGYPGSYAKNKVLQIGATAPCRLFVAGAEQVDGQLLTSGGRVLALVALAPTLPAARALCYEKMQQVHFDQMYYRKDIGTAE